jgi:hypothetical protein
MMQLLLRECCVSGWRCSAASMLCRGSPNVESRSAPGSPICGLGVVARLLDAAHEASLGFTA